MTTDAMAAAQALGGGVLIGLAAWLLFASLGRIAGISGIAAGAMVPAQADRGQPGHWRWMFLLGLVAGGAVASAWIAPPAVAMRPVWLLVLGGLVVGFSTVLGSGCTSGHGVCGLGRRSARSLVATLCFMGAGVASSVVSAYFTQGN